MTDQESPQLKDRMRLSQVVSVLNGKQSIKTRAEQRLTAAHHNLMRAPLLAGIARTYDPLNDADEKLPAESTKVQLRAEDVISEVKETLVELFDATATCEAGNVQAKATITVDGKALLTDVPVAYCFFLDRELLRLHTFVSKLPVLDPADDWHQDATTRAWATKTVQTARTKKTPVVITKAPATDKHPAQVEMTHEDKIAGYWSTTKFSGALPQTRVDEMLKRIEKLQKAVKVAREEANSIHVSKVPVGQQFLDYVFGG